ncbi:unnamed protein product [Malus baccata var. baccata]
MIRHLQPQTFLPQASLFPSLKPFKNPYVIPKSVSNSLKPTLSSPNYPSLSDHPNTSTDPGLLFREKVLYLETHLNVDSEKALHQNPDFPSCPLSSFKSVEGCLSSMGIERSAQGRILDMYPQLLTVDPHSALYPIFDFLLTEVRIPFPDIRKSIIRCSRLLVSDLDSQLRPALKFLTQLGFSGRSSITCQTTVLLVSSVEFTLLPKIDRKLTFFLEEMKRDVAELKRFPQYFSFSLEGKIKPRHRLLVEHGFSLPLRDMLKVSDGEFNARLIEMRLGSADGSWV